MSRGNVEVLFSRRGEGLNYGDFCMLHVGSATLLPSLGPAWFSCGRFHPVMMSEVDSRPVRFQCRQGGRKAALL